MLKRILSKLKKQKQEQKSEYHYDTYGDHVGEWNVIIPDYDKEQESNPSHSSTG